MSQNFDYSEHLSTPTDGDALSRLQALADTQAAKEARVAELEVELNRAQQELKDIAERQLPELMDEVGMKEFTTRSGLHVTIKEDVRASIPKARESDAFNWLREHGFASLVKREVKLSFGMGEDERANALLSQLLESNFEPDDKTSVHYSTLKSFVTGRLEKGEDLPLELFGVFRQRKSVIKV